LQHIRSCGSSGAFIWLAGIEKACDAIPEKYRFAHPQVMKDPSWRRGLAHLAEHNFLFEIQLFTSQKRDGAEVACEFPNTLFVLEHAGMLDDMCVDG
jgi:predicted TIM-barrel fold metal-dependent hydrolase